MFVRLNGVPHERYARIVRSAQAANMNMLRLYRPPARNNENDQVLDIGPGVGRTLGHKAFQSGRLQECPDAVIV